MVVLGRWTVSYERGTPVGVLKRREVPRVVGQRPAKRPRRPHLPRHFSLRGGLFQRRHARARHLLLLQRLLVPGPHLLLLPPFLLPFILFLLFLRLLLLRLLFLFLLLYYSRNRS